MGGRSISANRTAHGTKRAAKRPLNKRRGGEEGGAGSADPRVYQLKISLKRSKPLIWRRVLVPGDYELDFLHAVFQYVMGWTFSHLHDFFINGEHYGDLASAGEDLGFLDERDFRLREMVSKPREKFLYEYDFGDDWEHEVVVEKILAPKAGEFYPVCTGGKGACPPEDCGGVWGYHSMLEVLRDKAHPNHKQYRAWIGYDFDPDEFSLAAVNKELKRAFSKRQSA